MCLFPPPLLARWLSEGLLLAQNHSASMQESLMSTNWSVCLLGILCVHVCVSVCVHVHFSVQSIEKEQGQFKTSACRISRIMG